MNHVTERRRAVAFGGGGGLKETAKSLAVAGFDVTAVVAVTDNGRSTGLVRRLFDCPAPGDLRSVMTEFAANRGLSELFEYRLDTPAMPALSGVAFGNLFLGALTQLTHDFSLAVRRTAEALSTTIPVLPVSSDNVELAAELADGSYVVGEVDVRRPGKPAISRLFLQPQARLEPEVAAVVDQADLVVCGPGSLFTSVLACLATDGLADALLGASGTVVYVANTTTQPGQSDNLDLGEQVARIHSAMLGALDVVVANNGHPNPAFYAKHRAAGRHLLLANPEIRSRITDLNVRLIESDLLESLEEHRDLWQKEDSIHHDPGKLGAILASLTGEETSHP